MKVLSLFSGVGGFDMGLEAAGMTTVGLCEIDANCRKVLRRHWPGVPIYEDVSTVTATQLIADGVVPDVVAFGSPCQDLSVAGKRAGLAGSRSGLFGEAVRIIRELRKETHGLYPTFAIWENVVGAISSSEGADFAAVIDSLADAGALVLEWAVLDAQHFGVPQRRRRIFLVACFDPATASNCPDPLLPVLTGSPRDLAKSRKAKQGATPDVAGGAGSGGDGGVPSSRGEHLVAIGQEHIPFQQGSFGGYLEGEVGTLKASGGDLSGGSETLVLDGTRVDDVRIWDDGTTPTLKARMGTGGNNVPMVGQAFPIQDAREIEKQQNGAGIGEDGAPSYTLDQTGAQAVAIGIQGNVIGRQDHNGLAGKGHTEEGDPMFTLTSTDVHAVAFTTEQTPKWNDNQALTLTGGSPSGGGQPQAVAYLMRQREGKPGGGKGPLVSEDSSLTLATSNDQYLFAPVGFSHTQGLSAQPSEEAFPTLRREGSGMAVAYDEYNDAIGDVHQSLRAGTRQSTGVIDPELAVRRLTPLECERLMGWPDDHTRWADDGTEIKDTNRYKMCGNGVASPVAQWVGKHILRASEGTT